MAEKDSFDQMVERGRKSQLPECIQDDLIRQFVAGAIARAAADLVDVNQHTATLYFHMLLELLHYSLPKPSHGFLGRLKATKATWAAPGKANVDTAWLAKFRYSECSREAAKCMSLSSRMPNKIHSFRLFE